MWLHDISAMSVEPIPLKIKYYECVFYRISDLDKKETLFKYKGFYN